jgi:molybdate transport system substrate-binding protein
MDAGIIDGAPAVFAGNRLAIVVPRDNPAGITTAADLAKDGVKLVLAAAEVPVGQYARESICLMAADTTTYGEGFAERVGSAIVSEEDNVKAVLAKVQLGEADAGIVYVTDVTVAVSEEVQLIEIPDAVNVMASYPIAPVAGGNPELAAALIDYLLSANGQAVLVDHGFVSMP